jgi:hypothetical protein
MVMIWQGNPDLSVVGAGRGPVALPPAIDCIPFGDDGQPQARAQTMFLDTDY